MEFLSSWQTVEMRKPGFQFLRLNSIIYVGKYCVLEKLTKCHAASALEKGEDDGPSQRPPDRNFKDDNHENKDERGLTNHDDVLSYHVGRDDFPGRDSCDQGPLQHSFFPLRDEGRPGQSHRHEENYTGNVQL